VKTVRLTALPATQMAKVISAISLKSEGKSGCPNAIFGDDVLVQFSYPARTPVTLLYAASGCRYLTNGRRTGYETANPSFYNGFMALMVNVAGVQLCDNMRLWCFEWLIGGLLIGLLLGIVAALAIGDRLPSSSRRSPFYHAH
jgi:hypothetical protein